MDSEQANCIDSLIEALGAHAHEASKLNILLGIDGFVDNLVHVVDTRENSHEYNRVNTIEGFGHRILAASGLSTNIELVAYQTKLGGNGPNMAAALQSYGAKLSYFGAIGLPGNVHPVFREMAGKCAAVYPIAQPGQTDALEFADGKIMLGKLSTLTDITWGSLKAAFGGAQGLADAISNADVVGIENWTMVPHMSDIWESMITEAFPLMQPAKQRPYLFFDLCDPQKRPPADIAHALSLISRFEQKFRVILGLNHKELYEIAAALGVNTIEKDDKELSRQVYKKLGIHTLAVHPVREAFAWCQGHYFHVTGPYCEKPVLTTGAGDNFNAGFSLGMALGLSAHQSLVLGVATSGFYVRNGESPSLPAVRAFLADWKKFSCV